MIKGLIRSLLTFVRVNIGRARKSQISIGKDSYIAAGAFFSANRDINIGSRTYIGRNSALSCHLNIGDDVLIASNVSFVGGDHKVDNINTTINQSGRDEIKYINVDDNVWIGHGAIIMHGVKLNSGCVVASGAIVTKDVPHNAIVGGNPAKLIRYRKIETI